MKRKESESEKKNLWLKRFALLMADNHYGQLVTAKQDQREEARLKGKVRQGDNLKRKYYGETRNSDF